MNKTGIIALLLVATLVGVALAYVATMNFPMRATVPSDVTFTTTIEGTVWTGGAMLDWGPTPPGTYSLSLDVENTGNTAGTVYLYYTPLPTDWTLTWASNGTLLDPAGHALSDMVLTVPSTATSGTYNWDATVSLETP